MEPEHSSCRVVGEWKTLISQSNMQRIVVTMVCRLSPASSGSRIRPFRYNTAVLEITLLPVETTMSGESPGMNSLSSIAPERGGAKGDLKWSPQCPTIAQFGDTILCDVPCSATGSRGKLFLRYPLMLGLSFDCNRPV